MLLGALKILLVVIGSLWIAGLFVALWAVLSIRRFYREEEKSRPHLHLVGTP